MRITDGGNGIHVSYTCPKQIKKYESNVQVNVLETSLENVKGISDLWFANELLMVNGQALSDAISSL